MRYFRCPGCSRWVSSTYAEVLRSEARFRAHKDKPAAAQDAEFAGIKDRLERWLAALEEQDPYRVLGVSPLDPTEQIKTRFRELALERHPDRGGSEEQMRELNLAYERVCAHRARQRRDSAQAPRLQAITPVRHAAR